MPDDIEPHDERRTAPSEWRGHVDEHMLNLDEDLGNLEAKVDALTEFLRGSGIGAQDSVEERLKEVERFTRKHNLLLEGEVLGRPGLIRRLELITNRVNTLEDGSDTQTQRRGQNVTIVVAAISLIGTITVAVLMYWPQFHKAPKPAHTRHHKGEARENAVEDQESTWR